MDDSKRNFLEILKKTYLLGKVSQPEVNSLNWYYLRYIDRMAKFITANKTLDSTDKLLRSLTRFYIDNQEKCQVLAETYQEVRRGYFLYKRHRYNKEFN